MRQPVHYLTHGAGPCFWISFPEPLGAHAFDGLKDYLTGLLARSPERPRAIVLVSAHWEEDEATISRAASPGMLYDYSGFPAHTYQLQYPAPGLPGLADEIGALLDAAGIVHRFDAVRGFDHGVFVPLLIAAPKADIPVVMLSLERGLNARRHLALGAALAPLRERGVLIIASGSSYHNLRGYFSRDAQAATEFDTWLNQTVAASPSQRTARLEHWQDAPSARLCHPRAEHLIPLMVAAGAAGDDVGVTTFHAPIANKPFSCFMFGADAWRAAQSGLF